MSRDSRTRLYKHSRMRDMAAEFVSITYELDTSRYKAHIYWWNIGPHDPFYTGVDQLLTLTREQLADWNPYNIY